MKRERNSGGRARARKKRPRDKARKALEVKLYIYTADALSASPKEATRGHTPGFSLSLRAPLTDVKCDKRAVARFLFYSQGASSGSVTKAAKHEIHTLKTLSLPRILRCALRIKHPSRRFICARVLFYCFPVERSKCCVVPLFVLQSNTQVGETHLALHLDAALWRSACCKYNGAVLWPEMCDKLRQNCMPVIVILTLSCRGHAALLLKSCLRNPAPGCINLGFTS